MVSVRQLAKHDWNDGGGVVSRTARLAKQRVLPPPQVVERLVTEGLSRSSTSQP